jgi:hypothetical protein
VIATGHFDRVSSLQEKFIGIFLLGKTFMPSLLKTALRRISFELLDDIPLLHDVILVLRCLAIRASDPAAWTGPWSIS